MLRLSGARGGALWSLWTVRPLSTSTPRYAMIKPEPEGTEAVLKPAPRPNETTEAKRARLIYTSRKRGILETDLLLSQFAALYIPKLTREQLDEFDDFSNEQDWSIYYWVSETDSGDPCPERWKNSWIMDALRKIASNPKRGIMRMPEL